MKNLESHWDIDSYPVLEYRALWEVLSTLVKGDELQRLGNLIGLSLIFYIQFWD